MPLRLNAIQNDVARDQLLNALPKAFTQLDPVEQIVSLGIYQLLAMASPVEVSTLAETLQLPIDKIKDIIEQWIGVYHDDQQRIIGYWGLAVGEMPHRLVLDDQTLYAWCAWDSLFIPPLINKTTTIHSRCATTHLAIELVVSPSGIESITPSTAVMSFVGTEGKPIEDDIINQFCHYVLFFHTADAGAKWIDQHPGTFLMTIDDGFALGQRKNQRQYTIEVKHP